MLFTETVRRHFLTVSAASIAIALSGAAHASETDADQAIPYQDGRAVNADESAYADSEGGEIIVSGVRASLRSAADQKRNASQIIDSITAEDIGKFPTENVADASQRITGVQITRTRGSGTGASIRGLPTDFTRVQLNGSTLSSAIVDLRGGGAGGNISRSFDFRLLPTEFVSAVEVVKSPTAELQEGGLSGTVNVKTVRPLELGKTTLVGSAFGVQNSNDGTITPNASGLFSTTLAGGRLGLLVAGGYSHNKTETHNINAFAWGVANEASIKHDLNNDGDLTDSFNIPGQIRTEIAREDRKRSVITGVAEYQATDSLRLYAEGLYSHFDIDVESFENLHNFSQANGGVFDHSTTQVTNIDGIASYLPGAGLPFLTTLGRTDVDVRGNDRVNDSTAQTYFAKLGAEFDNDVWSGGASFSYSRSKQVGDNLNVAQIQRFQVTAHCQPGQDICGLTLSPESADRYLDPEQGVVASLNGAFNRKTQDEVKEAKADLRREFEGSALRRIAVGGVASWRQTFADANTLVVNAAQLASLVDLPLTTVQASGYGLGKYTQLVTPSRGEFLGAYNGSQSFPQQWIATDTLALLKDIPRDALSAVPGAVQANLSGVLDVQERIFAGYVQADFASADDRLTGNVGVRVVNTRAIAKGVSPDLTGLVVQQETGGTVTVPPAGDVAVRHSYTEFLPSANLRFEAADGLILRLAGSRTLSRPSLSQISPSTTVGAGGGNYTVNTGNPYLDPFISTNFDASAEWYPNSDTALTVAVFHKRLSSLVRSTTEPVTLPITIYTASTDTYTVRDEIFRLTQPTNQEGVNLTGFELGYQQAFTFLPGPLKNTGLQANYTFISNSNPDELTAASKNKFNVSAFYEDRRFGARLSYTWRDKFVSSGLPDGNNGLGLTTQARGNLDVNITFNATDRLSLILQGTNVLEDVDKSVTTLGNLPADYYDTGRQLMAGVRFRL